MKTLTQMLVDLRLDLKDSGALWSDAELTRCVSKAVADLSRFLPLERTLEVTIDATVTDETVTMPASTALTAIVSAQSIDVAGGSFLAISGQPDVPRPLTLTITDADSSAYGITFIIIGTDKDENSISETFHYSRGDSKTIVGKKYFKTVYTVELDQDAGSHAGDTLSVGYGLYSGVWVYLANKPIKAGTVTLTSSPAGTTYTLDTDFEMDYANGAIRAIAGKLAASATYLIDYTKSNISFDLSSLDDFIRVDRVENPYGEIPRVFSAFELWNKVLTITGGTETQSEVSDTDHLAIHYLAEQRPPTEYRPATYPGFLEPTVELATSAYALLIKAIQYEHQAVTDFASARSALVKIATYLETNSNYSAKLILEDITTTMHSDAITAAKAANAVLSALSPAALSVTESDLNAIYTEQKKFILTTGGYDPMEIQTLLAAGDDYINAVNLGADVARIYNEYALTSVRVIEALGQITASLVSLDHAEASNNGAVAQSMGAVAQSLQAAAAGASVLVDNARSYTEEAAQWIAIARTFADEGTSYISAAQANLALADRFRTEATERRNEAWAIWSAPNQVAGQYTMSAGVEIIKG